MSNASTSTGPFLSLGIDISIDVDGTFYGNAIATALFGITIVQAWIYINTNNDKWPLRMLVGTLVMADFTTTCLDTQIMHHYFIANFGNVVNLQEIPVPLTMEVLLTILIVFCVEVFFASRVWLLKQFHWTVPLVIVLSALGAVVTGLATVVTQAQNPTLDYMGTASRPRIEIGFDSVLSAFSDIVATTALCWGFSKSQTGIKRTDSLLQKLFQYTVTRGVFVSVDQTIFVIIYLIKPEKLWWMPFHLSLSKVYVITMVAILNSRDSLRNDLDSKAIITDSDMRCVTHSASQTTIGNAKEASETIASKHFTISAVFGSSNKEENSQGTFEMDTYKRKNGIHNGQLPNEDV